MTSGIRNGKNKLSHYLDNVQGCGNHIEGKLRKYFFSVLKSILANLKQTKDKQEAVRLLDAVQWHFSGRDFDSLCDLDIFKVLRLGGGQRKSILKRAWGHALKQKVGQKDKESEDLT